jgi:RimJ/RimL family protein N-acetyltransferase
MTLCGRVIDLVPLSLDHAARLVDAANEDRSSYAYTTVPATRQAMSRYIEDALSEQSRGTVVAFSVRERESHRLVGSTRFLDIDYWLPSGERPTDDGVPPRAVEIGATWYAASVQRSAVNTEAKFLLLSHAFESWGVARVSFKTDERNARSRAAIARLGATFEGVRRAHRLGVDGAVRNSAYYSIIRSEWPEVKDVLGARLGVG